MLSVICDWIVKRNAQHVLQRRWCCIVIHTFLYYFEAEPLIDKDGITAPEAVAAPSRNGTLSTWPYGRGTAIRGPINSHRTTRRSDRCTNLQPVGIIVLECYSNVNRSCRNDRPGIDRRSGGKSRPPGVLLPGRHNQRGGDVDVSPVGRSALGLEGRDVSLPAGVRLVPYTSAAVR